MTAYASLPPEAAADQLAEDLGKEADFEEAVERIIESDEILELASNYELDEMLLEQDYETLRQTARFLHLLYHTPNFEPHLSEFLEEVRRLPTSTYCAVINHDLNTAFQAINLAVHAPTRSRKRWDRTTRALLDELRNFVAEQLREQDEIWEHAADLLKARNKSDQEDAEIAKAEAKGVL